MLILSFDPGLSPGCAELDTEIENPGDAIISCAIDSDPDIPISPRLLEISQFIRTKIQQVNPDLIAVEAVNRVFGGAKNRHSFALYYSYGEILRQAYDLGKLVITISPTTVKSRFAKDYKADKAKICKTASEYLGRKITNHNEGDAIGIAVTAQQLYAEYLDPNKPLKKAKPKKGSKNAGKPKAGRSRGTKDEFSLDPGRPQRKNSKPRGKTK